jgi:hypothetical protein
MSNFLIVNSPASSDEWSHPGEDSSKSEEEAEDDTSDEELQHDRFVAKKAKTSTKWPKDMIIVTGIDREGCQKKGGRI